MIELLLFGIASILLIIISWPFLLNLKSHGFYRFLSWECILLLFLFNYKFWFVNPFSFHQIISWIFLFGSIYLVIAGVLLLKRKGNHQKEKDNRKLYAFEKTTQIIKKGIYKYIRHPMYSSLLFLGWGIFLKHPDLQSFITILFTTLFLYFTALMDERACIEHFGESYRNYMNRSKKFIPFIF